MNTVILCGCSAQGFEEPLGVRLLASVQASCILWLGPTTLRYGSQAERAAAD